jgi:hypothetical protein
MKRGNPADGENFVEDSQGVMTRFNRLMRDVENGLAARNCFRDWEVELLLDMANCDLGDANRKRTLQRYRKAVERRLERGDTVPMKLSEYLAHNRERYAGRRHAA